jgi:hypothetical protein
MCHIVNTENYRPSFLNEFLMPTISLNFVVMLV